jgi:ubiquitin C-terminal hydrolase
MASPNVLSFKPCGLANQNGVCYSNAVLQCLSRLTNPYDLQSRLGLVDPGLHKTCCPRVNVTSPSEVDGRITQGLENVHPAVDFLWVIREMQNRRTHVVYPYYFQAVLAARGGERGEEFASGQGAYPFCWLKFVLDSLCEGTNFNGHPNIASNDVICWEEWIVH